jgi:cytochrome P450
MTCESGFPIGASVTAEALALDPYPIYQRMREAEPISWVPALGMYYVVRYEHVDQILKQPELFTVGTDHSTLFDTFGLHMLTVEDPLHARYKSALFPAFLPPALRDGIDGQIRSHAADLISGFCQAGQAELRTAFAARLPILTMLSFFGLPLEQEGNLRLWYDSFERALANFSWDASVRAAARENVDRFRALIQQRVEYFRGKPRSGALLSALVHAPTEERLDDEEIARNALIVLFGGISTVEALILNAVYALSSNPEALTRVRGDTKLLRAVVEETVRWAGPVQSATRHVARDTELEGVALRKGDTVNCMLAAANRDPQVFVDPDRFDIDRPALRKHLGFAIGAHHCLGANLAKLEGRIALEELLIRLPRCRVEDLAAAKPYGNEFRQPNLLTLVWDRV